MEPDRIVITGARQHNLKNVTVEIPKKKLVVFTGVSGSGKSSLAFDTLYAEGQRRYIESLSAYARQFLGQMDKPLYDSIRGLAPTISIEQKTASTNPRSTVGTVTELHDYLRVLWARVGRLRCYRCGRPVSQQSAQQIVQEVMELPEGTKFLVLAPLVGERKGEHRDVLEQVRKSGFARVRVDGMVLPLEEEIRLDKKKKHSIDAVVDRLVAKPGIRQRLTDSIETALRHGQGVVVVAAEGQPEKVLSEHRACHHCGISFPELTPQLFSFNSPQGMCPECSGLGTRMEMDPELVVPNPELSVNEGAVKPLGAVGEATTWGSDIVRAVARERGIDLNRPWRALSEAHRRVILFGTGEERVQVRFRGSMGTGAFRMRYEGAMNSMMRRMRETKSEEMRQYYQRFLSSRPCSACAGRRVRPEALGVTVGGRTIAEVTALSVAESSSFFEALQLQGAEAKIAAELLKEIRARLRFLLDVGLTYLTLDRPAPSLSGGESQRIRLASQIGSELTGVIYVLDEPSIGLHQRDNRKLLAALAHLRDIGNTVVVVEHDREAMEEADWLVDFGPGAGRHGGEIVAAGTPAEVARVRASLTGRYLSGELAIELPAERRRADGRRLTVVGACENNLKQVTASFPLGLFVCVTGVSGAGKSTLVNHILYPAAARALQGSELAAGAHQRVEGLSEIDKVIDIDQSPIGRTPRSNPATYTKLFDLIRDFFAELPEARMHGYDPGRFSFNVKGGRCEACEGDGVKRVEMHFLPDVYVPCEVCHGRRFNEATLAVKYNGLSVADVLDLTVDEALQLFRNHPAIRRSLETLADVGLGYIALGQSSPTLSGGEAQRVKLSRELSKRSTGRTLYVLDEPTTGLHFDDIRKLLRVLDRLVEAGNTVVVIEHNLDVIKTADWIIDLGPEGGDGGGRIVAEGTPEQVAAVKDSYTGRYLGPLLGRRASARTGRPAR
ncbi:MAG TPA: excinuclease ABC subunit UvrA [Vicinamibacteria bacterium]|nr:excinuclease ABC subunit UvrA [Vicinamibacteria bacterium]